MRKRTTEMIKAIRDMRAHAAELYTVLMRMDENVASHPELLTDKDAVEGAYAVLHTARMQYDEAVKAFRKVVADTPGMRDM